jgi:hypothetical protein
MKSRRRIDFLKAQDFSDLNKLSDGFATAGN